MDVAALQNYTCFYKKESLASMSATEGKAVAKLVCFKVKVSCY